MKKIILLSFFSIFIHCKPQNNEKIDDLDIDGKDIIKVDTIKYNNSEKKDDDKKKIKNEKEYTNMIIKYQENLTIPKEDLEKIPSEFKEQIVSLFSKPIFYELRTNLKQSLYQTISDDSKVYSSSDAGRTNETKVILPTLNVYKDFITLDLIKQDQLVDKTYLINDKLNKIDWKIFNEKLKIDDFVCKKATALVNNKKIIAYFTEEISIGDGPSIFYGLPGLILKVEAPDRTYSVLEINYRENVEVQKFKKGTVITPKDFEEITKKMKENPSTTTHNEVRQ